MYDRSSTTLLLWNNHFHSAKVIKNSKWARLGKLIHCILQGWEEHTEWEEQKSPLCQKPYATEREMWTFPKAAADKVCSGRSGEACCDCLEAWIMFWGIFRITCCQENTALWRGLGTWSTRTFSCTHHPESRFISKAPLQQGKSIPFLLQLGNVGISILLTFPRLQSQTGAAGSWSGLLIRALITPSNLPSSSKATTSAV